jgi:hypothetical protein
MKPIAWYDPSNGMVSTDQDCPLFTPLGQVWGLYPKEEASASPKDAALRLALETFESMSHKDSIFAGEFDNEITAIKAALEANDEPVREPIAMLFGSLPVYDIPVPQRTWVALTDEEKNKISFIAGSDKYWLISLVENKLKEKNT